MARWFLLVVGLLLNLLSSSSSASAQGLAVLWIDPVQGPICAGPLGPGPCAAVAQWITNHPPLPQVGLPRPPNLPSVYQAPGGGGPVPVPSNIQPLTATIPVRSVDGAIQCAQLTGQARQVNVDAFLTCTRGALVLSRDSTILVNCVEHANGDETRLATCAGRGVIGDQLTEDQIRMFNCAADHAGDQDDFAGCIANGLGHVDGIPDMPF
jgi:hypothetical protein